MTTTSAPVALVTGAAKRIGAEIARHLHNAGYNLIVHYHQSAAAADELVQQLNQLRPDSALAVQAHLGNQEALQQLAHTSIHAWQRLDLLVNNASSFYPTPLGQVDEATWDDLLDSNLKAPFFLAQSLAEKLRESQGAIINIADIYAERPLQNHSVYCIAKAGNVMLTKTLAKELAPHVRVNGIAPGAILWPEQEAISDDIKSNLLTRTPLQERGQASDIARAILFLAQEAPYITGQILAVDGGRSLTI
ncbi:pteridine reductase [Cellvibrio japonicus]|uniref:Oxidoreductase, short chain dehydrogenase/reductase family n=1 Tax=Cellvibrio japonicus (strain Ueda107) TaxID=498211 RepID=B3PKA9_CELJU|nr:pteridine reductase [Cellvibrio japonicus]ACE86023.1 oxidoreductase, short chain dehydrogenase/reductase family [Cellvibrio japonicus Ueda107]QEI11426.1 pteridine reductase [Cellvibrio japonicus]QEI15000.1 pteridine reductase [Cellvibrio japonicus]QEI18580.1 pteridine reductase [Cellvibrio japonicus]